MRWGPKQPHSYCSKLLASLTVLSARSSDSTRSKHSQTQHTSWSTPILCTCETKLSLPCHGHHALASKLAQCNCAAPAHLIHVGSMVRVTVRGSTATCPKHTINSQRTTTCQWKHMRSTSIPINVNLLHYAPASRQPLHRRPQGYPQGYHQEPKAVTRCQAAETWTCHTVADASQVVTAYYSRSQSAAVTCCRRTSDTAPHSTAQHSPQQGTSNWLLCPCSKRLALLQPSCSA